MAGRKADRVTKEQRVEANYRNRIKALEYVNSADLVDHPGSHD